MRAHGSAFEPTHPPSSSTAVARMFGNAHRTLRCTRPVFRCAHVALLPGTLALLCPVACHVLMRLLARVSPCPMAPRDGPFQGADLRGAIFLGSSGIPP